MLAALMEIDDGARRKYAGLESPWQNAYVESFNSSLRRDLLDVEVFHNLADAQIKLSLYRRFYNE